MFVIIQSIRALLENQRHERNIFFNLKNIRKKEGLLRKITSLEKILILVFCANFFLFCGSRFTPPPPHLRNASNYSALASGFSPSLPLSGSIPSVYSPTRPDEQEHGHLDLTTASGVEQHSPLDHKFDGYNPIGCSAFFSLPTKRISDAGLA